MSTEWRLAHVNQILHWAEEKHLSAQQVAQLESLAPLRPSRATWLQAGTRFCTFVGVLLLAAAVVFFFAYNWDAMNRFAKLGLAAGALTACVAAALASRPGGVAWQSALFGAAACTGALLALIGQTYQTGADIWELFAAWTVLMLPFVLLARALSAWLLCLLVSNLWLIRMLWQSAELWQWGIRSAEGKLALWLVFAALWWLLAWFGARWMVATPSRYLERITAALALAGLTIGAVLGLFDGDFVAYIVLFSAAAGSGFWFYQHRRPDIVMLGVLGVCSIVFVSGALQRIFWSDFGSAVFGAFITAAFVLGASGYLAVWLKKLYRQQHQQHQQPQQHTAASGDATTQTVPALLAVFAQHRIVDDAQRQTLAAKVPSATWLSILQALAAWLAALSLTSAFALIGAMAFELYFLFGVGLIAAGLALFWRNRDATSTGEFSAHLALGLSVSGQMLMAFAWRFEHGSDALGLLLSAALALALTIPRTSLLHRSLCWIAALACAYHPFYPSMLGLFGWGLTALSVVLWLTRRHWVKHAQAAYVTALAHGATVMGLAAIMMFDADTSPMRRGNFLYGHGAGVDYSAYIVSAVLVWLATSGWLWLRVLPKRERLTLALAAGGVAALGAGAPSMLLCLALMLATFYACQRVWLVISLASGWLFLGLFYYSLHQELWLKSATLAAVGAAVLALGGLLRSWQNRVSQEISS